MTRVSQISTGKTLHTESMLACEATNPASHRGFEAMARRRFQKPTPFKEGQFWWLFVWDTNVTGSRKRQRIKLAKADMAIREVQKIAEEKLRPLNQGLALTGSAMILSEFVTDTYIPTYLPLLSSSMQASYKGVMSAHLKHFGKTCLRDLTRQRLQQYFSGMAGKVSYPTISKIRDVLRSEEHT